MRTTSRSAGVPPAGLRASSPALGGVTPPVQPPRTAALLVFAMLLAASCHKAVPPRAAVAPPRPTAYELQLGKQVYVSYCIGCHGESGAGDGFNSFNLDPHPRDLADPAFQKSKSNADLADAIRRGGAGVGLTALMPPWGHTLDARHIDAVVLYVRSLRRL